MTVSELIEDLSELNQNSIVIIQKYCEGSGQCDGYSPLSGCEEGIYIADSDYSGIVVDPDETLEVGVKCVVLWPVN